MAYEDFTDAIEECNGQETVLSDLQTCITDELEVLQQKLDECEIEADKIITIASECDALIAQKYEDDEAECEELSGDERADCLTEKEEHRTLNEPMYQILCTCAKTATFNRDE